MTFLFDSKPDWSTLAPQRTPGVNVILRTRDRPLFLKRALSSIVSQKFPQLALCVINDGGDQDLTERIVRTEIPEGVALDLVHCEKSLGQVAALNLGYARVRREFFAVHDDDDTWAPEFLSSMIGFLQCPENSRYIGAVCHSDLITETVDGKQIAIQLRVPHYRHDGVLSLFELLCFYSHPPPISAVMRSAAIDIVPTNNTAMPVMYDIEWMIRLLLKADVVVLPETLAFYHHRTKDYSVNGAARNSVFELTTEFSRLPILTQNELLRAELAAGNLGIGFISSLLHHNKSDASNLSYEARHYIERKAKRYYRYRSYIRKIEGVFKRLRRSH